MTVHFQMLGNAALMEQPKAFRNGRDARCPSAPPRRRLSMWEGHVPARPPMERRPYHGGRRSIAVRIHGAAIPGRRVGVHFAVFDEIRVFWNGGGFGIMAIINNPDQP